MSSSLKLTKPVVALQVVGAGGGVDAVVGANVGVVAFVVVLLCKCRCCT